MHDALDKSEPPYREHEYESSGSDDVPPIVLLPAIAQHCTFIFAHLSTLNHLFEVQPALSKNVDVLHAVEKQCH